MTIYSVQPRDWIFVKDCGTFSFAKIIGKNIGKNISKNLSGKHSQKRIDYAKQAVTVACKTATQRVI